METENGIDFDSLVQDVKEEVLKALAEDKKKITKYVGYIQ